MYNLPKEMLGTLPRESKKKLTRNSKTHLQTFDLLWYEIF